MPDQQEIIQAAEKLGQLVVQHPAIEKLKQAQKAVADDPDTSRLVADFDKQIETLARQEQSGMHVTDAQRLALEGVQTRIMSNAKMKDLNAAQVEFSDFLRKVSQTWQKPLAESLGASAAPRAAGPRIAR